MALQVTIHRSNIWIGVMSRVRQVSRLSVRPSILRDKNLNAGYYKQTFQPPFFTPVMFIGTIDFHHFIPLSLTSTLTGGHKVSAIQTLLASFSPTLFSRSK